MDDNSTKQTDCAGEERLRRLTARLEAVGVTWDRRLKALSQSIWPLKVTEAGRPRSRSTSAP